MSSKVEIDLYEVLEISSSASKEEIRKAYRKAALANHPDKVPEAEREAAEVRFKAVQEAYDILYDEDKRHLYDTHGMSAFNGSGEPGMGPGGPDLDDILAQMFGGMGGMPGGMGGMPGGPQARKPRRSANEEQKYEVSLEDLYKGKTVKFSSTKNVICSLCRGKGGKERATAKKCATCDGHGVKQILRPMGQFLSPTMVTCSTCKGQGEFFSDKDKCKKCKGQKTTEAKKLLEIYIPRGAREGDKIILEGEADEVPGQEPGDIIFHLVEEEHPVFKRAGPDLTAEIDVTLAEALTGFSRVVIKHLDGRGIELKHPKVPGQVLSPNQVLKVPGEGMPIKRGDARGDLYLIVNIKFPDETWKPTPAVLEQLREMLPKPDAPIPVETVDEIEYDPKGNIEDFGAHDPEGGSAWEDDDEEGETAQCTTQ
ncbi:putative DnaJ domain protein (Mas5) [Aspergillus aculeatinus CBS 121060]|uniref:Protein import protein mas5 n=1 Tax=Aspergillus aculeatinus CBS 121060 TaxID=1448322 RepID=A0ACD1H285_9EURO|nr:protein import protein mas5 [Aspergillus aculeatinus CBS 121060]RAH67654.1 protein import protein mas5 [Aspergillus aculeatinus CBS 121060]